MRLSLLVGYQRQNSIATSVSTSTLSRNSRNSTDDPVPNSQRHCRSAPKINVDRHCYGSNPSLFWNASQVSLSLWVMHVTSSVRQLLPVFTQHQTYRGGALTAASGRFCCRSRSGGHDYGVAVHSERSDSLSARAQRFMMQTNCTNAQHNAHETHADMGRPGAWIKLMYGSSPRGRTTSIPCRQQQAFRGVCRRSKHERGLDMHGRASKLSSK